MESTETLLDSNLQLTIRFHTKLKKHFWTKNNRYDVSE